MSEHKQNNALCIRPAPSARVRAPFSVPSSIYTGIKMNSSLIPASLTCSPTSKRLAALRAVTVTVRRRGEASPTNRNYTIAFKIIPCPECDEHPIEVGQRWDGTYQGPHPCDVYTPGPDPDDPRAGSYAGGSHYWPTRPI